MTDNPAKPPRFPYVAALLCAACLGAAVWTWMRFSYCWNTDLGLLIGSTPAVLDARWPHRAYVEVEGAVAANNGFHSGVDGSSRAAYYLAVSDEMMRAALDRVILPTEPYLWVSSSHPEAVHSVGERARFCGRVEKVYEWVVDRQKATHISLNANASRWHGASIFGLVVGAMGVFVFAVYLRTWVKERRAWRKEAEGA